MACTLNPERMTAMFQPYYLELSRSSGATSLQASPSYEVNLVLLFNLNAKGELNRLRKPLKVLKLTSEDLTRPLELFFDEKVRSPQEQRYQTTPPESPIPLYSVAQVFTDIRTALEHEHQRPFDCSICDKCQALGESLFNLQQTFSALTDKLVDRNSQKELFEKARDVGEKCLKNYPNIFSAVVGRPSSEPPLVVVKPVQKGRKRTKLSVEERPRDSISPAQLLRAASAPNLARVSKSNYTSPIGSPLAEEHPEEEPVRQEPVRFVFPGPEEYARTP